MQIKIKKLHDDVKLPTYATDGSAGMDVYAYTFGWMPTNETRVFPLGFSVEIPYGYELQVRSRSGLSIKGVTVANSPGTIDSDFRGEVGVILHSKYGHFVEDGDRIAQMVLCPVERCEWEEVKELDDTERGEG